VDKRSTIRLLWLYILTVALFFQIEIVEAQKISPEQFVLDAYQSSRLLSLLYNRDKIHGSPYLVNGWLNGVAVLTNHQIISGKDQKYLFNYDKLNVRIYILSEDKKIWFYPVDSVSSFDFHDSATHYAFEKIHAISDRFFLTPVILSDRGYSLYKRLITHYKPSDYVNAGYYKEGNNYDEYVDFYEYYMVFPEAKKVKKLYLKEKSVIRALKNEAELVNAYFEINSKEFNEQSLLGLLQYINDKKYPE
jgi:hypothetical protein